MSTEETPTASRHFIQQQIDADLAAGRVKHVHTRFPPEPNGYLHIGHAKSICLNFGLAKEYAGPEGPRFNLRFDDTNPAREEQEYVDAIMDDVRWLGADWESRLYHASDYFETHYGWAVELIKAGHAYVCDQTAEQVRETRGTLTEAGTPSPYRGRSVEENLDLFKRMRGGEFADGAKTLRAKIDMSAANVNLRDPVMYRIKHTSHQRTGDAWCLYPAYDWAHGQGDAMEGITHSICTLEFENHRPLYDWYLDRLQALKLLPGERPRQIEFARLNLTYTVMSKRKLLQLVQEKHVAGWDDPRMPTLRGLRRRGYTAESIRAFCERIGVTKQNSTIDMLWLEDAVRDHLNETAPRRMAVLRPLKLVLTGYADGSALPPSDSVKVCKLDNHPQHPELGSRSVPLTRELWIEQDDFMEDAPKQFFRLKPGGAVRLRGAGMAICQEVIKDATGEVVELRCVFDPDTTALVEGKKVKGTIHWVPVEGSVEAEVRLYDHLFGVEEPDRAPEGETFLHNLNKHSLERLTAKLEPDLATACAGESYQFERIGYFFVDPIDSRAGAPCFNRTVTLRDTWGKVADK
ncbi:glutamine--tRNA ligase/YqeY domain fusion protein [Botrimarina hoheduenensis]|uniref:Glutamine--tRNA ligase n=1 Tax=Botrimarina hoheduenensis TaxID=2528000 RepID=A0A5C5VWE3_9BACT|nr:glutamine--tRNA ligase/YqeY domain fusion protein [Botrimarina hoheduenensis]TWT42938.1 Glutamine--tRNA ligase [Botrimarina hoheduenensis]